MASCPNTPSTVPIFSLTSPFKYSFPSGDTATIKPIDASLFQKPIDKISQQQMIDLLKEGKSILWDVEKKQICTENPYDLTKLPTIREIMTNILTDQKAAASSNLKVVT
jgi:hypothetical protein